MPLHLLGISRSADITSLPVHRPKGQPSIRQPRLEQTVTEPHRSEIRWVADGGLAAATVWPLPTTFGPLEHANLLAAIHARFSVLPARYGVGLPDEEAVQAYLSRRGRGLSSDLDRMEGTSEIGLRIQLACSPAAEPAAKDRPRAKITTEWTSQSHDNGCGLRVVL